MTISDKFVKTLADVTTNKLIGSKGKKLGDNGTLDLRNGSGSEKELEFGCNLKLNQLDPRETGCGM